MQQTPNQSTTANDTLFPACYVVMPDYVEGRSATFFLAAEEYVAQRFVRSHDDTSRQTAYLFTWRLAPTVVMGRNQVAHQEVDLEFCRREGIDVVRRKSGGGAIFADERNIMTSLVTGPGPVEPLFQAYAHAVSTALNSLGAETTVSGRNDILLTYRPTPSPLPEMEGSGHRVLQESSITGKICGNAFYHLTALKKQSDYSPPSQGGAGGGSVGDGSANIVHGTMLYDTDPRRMERALHPDLSKLQASGVKSVRSRVALLKDVLPFGVDELRRQLRILLTDREILLTDDDVRQIEAIERTYRTDEFLYGRRADLDTTLRQRIEGVGTLELQLSLHNGTVAALALAGDFFEPANDAEALFREAFVGQPFTPAVISERIAAVHPECAIRNLTADALLALLTQQ